MFGKLLKSANQKYSKNRFDFLKFHLKLLLFFQKHVYVNLSKLIFKCAFSHRNIDPLIWLNARDWRVNRGLTIDVN